MLLELKYETSKNGWKHVEHEFDKNLCRQRIWCSKKLQRIVIWVENVCTHGETVKDGAGQGEMGIDCVKVIHFVKQFELTCLPHRLKSLKNEHQWKHIEWSRATTTKYAIRRKKRIKCKWVLTSIIVSSPDAQRGCCGACLWEKCGKSAVSCGCRWNT